MSIRCQVIAGSITAPGFLGALGHNTRSSYHRGYHTMGAPPVTTATASTTTASSTTTTGSSSTVPAATSAAPPIQNEHSNLTSGNLTNVTQDVIDELGLLFSEPTVECSSCEFPKNKNKYIYSAAFSCGL